MHLIATTLHRLTAHRLCCSRIPEWTAHVGQPWDVYTDAPYNLYNVLWVLRHRWYLRYLD